MNYGTWGLKSDKDSLLRLQACFAFRQILLLMALIRRLLIVIIPDTVFILQRSVYPPFVVQFLAGCFQPHFGSG